MAKQTEFLNPAEAAAILWALEIALTENLELTTLSNLGVAFYDSKDYYRRQLQDLY